IVFEAHRPIVGAKERKVRQDDLDVRPPNEIPIPRVDEGEKTEADAGFEV
ncbi:unnamed protein product, partial [marine sediment metagenome]